MLYILFYHIKPLYHLIKKCERFTASLLSFTFLALPNCGDPGTPNNAIVISTNNWAGGYVWYYCKPGYIMLGPAIRMCLSSGIWSGQLPSCAFVGSGKLFC